MRVLSLLFLCLISTTVSAEPFFGQDGHALVASIAMTMLGVNATESCQTLLPSYNGNLTAIASWADSVVRTTAYKWSAVYHYADTPAWLCNYDRARDCHDSTGTPNACVDMAIQNYTQRLMDPSIGTDQMAEALKFLVHFIGDIHQPLHVGFTSDKGGNDESGSFLGTSNSKLHAIWDTLIIKKRIADDFAGSQAAYLSNLVARVAPGGEYANNLIPWLKCSPGGGDDHDRGACTVQWAQEGIGYACANAYVAADGVTRLVTGFNLQLDYYTRNLPIIEQRLVQAGVRLGHVLNNIWPSPSYPLLPRWTVA